MRACSGLAVLLLSGVAVAEAPTTPALAPAAPKASSWFGGGVALFSSEGRSDAGLALDAGLDVFFTPHVGLRLQFGWGLTGWDRAAGMVAFGARTGAWTTGGYSAVGTWLVTGDPAFFFFKLIASFFAFAFMSIGYLVAGLAFLFAPIAATSFLELGASAVGHVALAPEVDLSFHGGLGVMLSFGATSGRGSWGVGPLIGAAVRLRHVRVGAQALWSPAELQFGGRATSGAVGAMLTLGYAP